MIIRISNFSFSSQNINANKKDQIKIKSQSYRQIDSQIIIPSQIRALFQIINQVINSIMISILASRQQQQRQQQTICQQQKIIVNGISIRSHQWPKYIDTNNIQQITSLEYLHNYTYLQYCMFPDLFTVHINQMEVRELVELLNSYVGTFMEFFQDGLVYESSYEANVLLVSRGGGEVIKGEMRKVIESIQEMRGEKIRNGHKVECQRSIYNSLYTLAQQIPTLYNTTKTTVTLPQTQYIFQQSQMLQTILKQIKVNKQIVRSLFNLICKLVSKIVIKRQSIHCLVHSFLPRYLLHCVVSQLEKDRLQMINKNQRKRRQQQQHQQGRQQMLRQQCSIGLLRELIMLKMVPLYVQVYILYMTVVTGKMKAVDVSGWDWQVIKDNLYLAVGINDIVDRLERVIALIENSNNGTNNNYTQDQKQPANNCECQQIPTLEKMLAIIAQCLSKESKDIISNQQRPQQQRLNKELSIENIERVSRLFSKLLFEERMEVEDEFSNELVKQKQVERMLFNKNGEQLSPKQQYQVVQQQQRESIPYLHKLPQQFLIPYQQILNYLHAPQLSSQQYNDQNNLLMMSSSNNNLHEIMRRVSQYIRQLIGFINQEMRGVLGNRIEDNNNNYNECEQQQHQRGARGVLQWMTNKLQEIELQAGLAVELVNMILEELNQTRYEITTNNHGNDNNIQQTQQQQLLTNKLCSEIKKVKHSLYINLLAVRIIKHSLPQSKRRNKQQLSSNEIYRDSIQKSELQQHQQQKLTVNEVSRMFDDIFQLAETVYDIGEKQQKISSHPSLESVLYLFSALQLKLHISHIINTNYSLDIVQQQQHQKQQCNLVYSFMGKVINNYSQPTIAISTNQLIYVKYIIEMYQLFNLFLINQADSMNKEVRQNQNSNQEVVEKVGKMLRLMEQRGDAGDASNNNQVNLQQLINLSPCISSYLYTILPPIVSHTICPTKQNQYQNLQQDILAFTKIISLKYNQQTLTGEQLVKYIEKQLISNNLRTVKNMCQQQQVNRRKRQEKKKQRRKQKEGQMIQVVDLLNQSVVIDNISNNSSGSNNNNTKTNTNNNNTNNYNQSIKNVYGDKQVKTTTTSTTLSINTNNKDFNGLQQQQQQQEQFKTINWQIGINARRLLKIMGSKFKLFSMIKQQIVDEDECQMERLFENCYQRSVGFVIATVQLISSTKLIFHHVNSQASNYISSASSSSTQSTVHYNHLQSLFHIINNTSQQLLSLILNNLIQFKLIIYKLSPKQIDYLLCYQLQIVNQDNKNKLLEKIKTISRVVDQFIEFGVFMKCYLEWMLIETTVKLEYFGKRNLCQYQSSQLIKTNYHGDANSLITSSSFHLLRLLTLISWLPQNQFHTSFDFLESHLQSNLTTNQPQLIQTLKQLSFQKLSINQQVKKQLNFVQNYQFLQFIYQYVPFNVNSEQQERELYDVVEKYAKNGENHLYLSQQKVEKIRFNKLSAYLESMKRSQ